MKETKNDLPIEKKQSGLTKLMIFVVFVGLIFLLNGLAKMLIGAQSLIDFKVPELVTAPEIIFFIPLPQFLHDFPFALQMSSDWYGLPVTNTVTTTWIIMAFWFIVFKWGTSNLQLIPSKKQAFFESVYNALDGLVGQTLGSWKEKYVAYISTLIIFILSCNIITFFPIPKISYESGQVMLGPLFRAPTADLNTTVGLALITVAVFLGTAIKLGGVKGYIKGLFEPFPFMFPINLVGELAKPTNISIRLFGNMFAGMIILGLLYQVLPAFAPTPLHLYFDLFSGIIQAFVFTMLTMVYIQESLAGHEYQGE